MSLIYDDTYSYDTPNITFEGVGPIQNAYTDSNIAYRSSTASYQGAVVKTETASGSGVGSSFTASLKVRFRTADGAGIGTSTGVGVVTVPRTATGSGGATAGDSATGLRTAVDAATGSGAGC